MTLNFAIPGELKITMIARLKEIASLFTKSDNSESIADAPATEHLFKVNDDAKSPTGPQMTICHNFVAKCLSLTKQPRLDVSTTVALLSDGVKASDVKGWKNLMRVIQRMCGPTELPLIPFADSAPTPKWWIAGSHAAHPNVLGRADGCASLGKKVRQSRLPLKRSSASEVQQKLNS